MEVAILIIIFTALYMIYYEVKKTLKRKVFQKGQYEEEKRLVRTRVVMVTKVPKVNVIDALDRFIPLDYSAKGTFFGGVYRCEDTEDKRIYIHISKITSGGDGDEFEAEVYFSQQDNQLKVVGKITRWRECDGVTRKAGVEAMNKFLKNMEQAFHYADSNAEIDVIY